MSRLPEDEGYIQAKRLTEILRLRSVGYRPADIGDLLGVEYGGPIGRRMVEKILRDAAEEYRAENQATIARASLEQNERLEWLYSVCARWIEWTRVAEDGVLLPPDEKIIRAAVSILDRQARLLGLDVKTSMGPGASGQDWFASAPIQEVIKRGEQLGFIMPVKFE